MLKRNKHPTVHQSYSTLPTAFNRRSNFSKNLNRVLFLFRRENMPWGAQTNIDHNALSTTTRRSRPYSLSSYSDKGVIWSLRPFRFLISVTRVPDWVLLS